MNLSIEEIAKRINALNNWQQQISLPEGMITPGPEIIEPEHYRLPSDLTGKRVLVVDASDGFWAFECLKRGATEVVATNDISGFLGTSANSDPDTWKRFELCREILGYSAEQCRRLDAHSLQVNRAQMGVFDLTIAFNGLHKIKYPMLVLDKLSLVSKSEIYISSAILDDNSPYRGGLDCGYGNGQMVMEFYPRDEYEGDPTIWWVPTLHCFGHMVLSAGFNHVDGWKHADTPTDVSQCIGVVHGKKKVN
jgi:tRNA (mo5U34)-methyltransferase